jgi:hypothetical protein
MAGLSLVKDSGTSYESSTGGGSFMLPLKLAYLESSAASGALLVVSVNDTTQACISDITSSNSSAVEYTLSTETCSVDINCTSSVEVNVTIVGADDYSADGDVKYSVGVTSGFWLTTQSSYRPPTMLLKSLSYTVVATNLDVNFAGLEVSQAGVVYQAKLGAATVYLSDNKTYEFDILFSNWSVWRNSSYCEDHWHHEARCVRGTYYEFTQLHTLDLEKVGLASSGVRFNVSLGGKPSANVTVSVTTRNVSVNGGEARAEGVPSRSSYTLIRYVSDASWASGYRDTISNLDNGSQLLVFTPSSWNETQEVMIYGLDDFYDDGDVDYTVYLTLASTDTRYDSSSNGLVVEVPLTNVNDDSAGKIRLHQVRACV